MLGGAPGEGGRNTVLTDSPLLWSSAVAASLVIPTTSGMEKARGPLETIRVTSEPFGALLPAGGLVRITSPNGTVSENCWVCFTANPRLTSAAWAFGAGCPLTSGIW